MTKNIAQKLAAAKSTKPANADKVEAKAKVESAKDRAARQEKYNQAKATKTAEVRKEFAGLLHHKVTVTGGKSKSLEIGTEGECNWLGVSRAYLGPLASFIITVGGKPVMENDKPKLGWINPAHLTAGEKLSAARIAVITAEREAEANETVMIDGRVLRQGDKGLTIRVYGIAKDLSFALTMVELVGEMPPVEGEVAGNPIYAVPAWKLRMEVGQLTLDALAAKQGMYAEHLTA